MSAKSSTSGTLPLYHEYAKVLKQVMPIKQVLTSQRVPVKIWTDDVDENSKQQLANIASLPFIHHHVAAM